MTVETTSPKASSKASLKTSPKPSRDLAGPRPRINKERDTQEAIIEDAGETEDQGRDLVHGRTIAIPTKPGDMSRDD